MKCGAVLLDDPTVDQPHLIGIRSAAFEQILVVPGSWGQRDAEREDWATSKALDGTEKDRFECHE